MEPLIDWCRTRASHRAHSQVVLYVANDIAPKYVDAVFKVATGVNSDDSNETFQSMIRSAMALVLRLSLHPELSKGFDAINKVLITTKSFYTHNGVSQIDQRHNDEEEPEYDSSSEASDENAMEEDQKEDDDEDEQGRLRRIAQRKEESRRRHEERVIARRARHAKACDSLFTSPFIYYYGLDPIFRKYKKTLDHLTASTESDDEEASKGEQARQESDAFKLLQFVRSYRRKFGTEDHTDYSFETFLNSVISEDTLSNVLQPQVKDPIPINFENLYPDYGTSLQDAISSTNLHNNINSSLQKYLAMEFRAEDPMAGKYDGSADSSNNSQQGMDADQDEARHTKDDEDNTMFYLGYLKHSTKANFGSYLRKNANFFLRCGLGVTLMRLQIIVQSYLHSIPQDDTDYLGIQTNRSNNAATTSTSTNNSNNNNNSNTETLHSSKLHNSKRMNGTTFVAFISAFKACIRATSFASAYLNEHISERLYSLIVPFLKISASVVDIRQEVYTKEMEELTKFLPKWGADLHGAVDADHAALAEWARKIGGNIRDEGKFKPNTDDYKMELRKRLASSEYFNSPQITHMAKLMVLYLNDIYVENNSNQRHSTPMVKIEESGKYLTLHPIVSNKRKDDDIIWELLFERILSALSSFVLDRRFAAVTVLEAICRESATLITRRESFFNTIVEYKRAYDEWQPKFDLIVQNYIKDLNTRQKAANPNTPTITNIPQNAINNLMRECPPPQKPMHTDLDFSKLSVEQIDSEISEHLGMDLDGVPFLQNLPLMIHTSQMVKVLFTGANLHVAIIPKAKEILCYLADLQYITKEDIRFVWNSQLSKHASIVHLIWDTIATLSSHILSLDLLEFIFDLIKRDITLEQQCKESLLMIQSVAYAAHKLQDDHFIAAVSQQQQGQPPQQAIDAIVSKKQRSSNYPLVTTYAGAASSHMAEYGLDLYWDMIEAIEQYSEQQAVQSNRSLNNGIAPFPPGLIYDIISNMHSLFNFQSCFRFRLQYLVKCVLKLKKRKHTICCLLIMQSIFNTCEPPGPFFERQASSWPQELMSQYAQELAAIEDLHQRAQEHTRLLHQYPWTPKSSALMIPAPLISKIPQPSPQGSSSQQQQTGEWEVISCPLWAKQIPQPFVFDWLQYHFNVIQVVMDSMKDYKTNLLSHVEGLSTMSTVVPLPDGSQRISFPSPSSNLDRKESDRRNYQVVLIWPFNNLEVMRTYRGWLELFGASCTQETFTGDLLEEFWNLTILQGITMDELMDNFHWIRSTFNYSARVKLLSPLDIKTILRKFLEQVNPERATFALWETILMFIVDVGWQEKNWIPIDNGANLIADIRTLEGLDLIWDIATRCEDERAGEAASQTLARYYESPQDSEDKNAFHSHFVARSTAILESYSFNTAYKNYTNRNLVLSRCLAVIRKVLAKNKPTPTSRGNPIKFTMKPVTGPTFDLTLYSNDTIASMRAKCSEITGGDVRLIVGGKQLDISEDKTLISASPKIGSSTVIHVVVKKNDAGVVIKPAVPSAQSPAPEAVPFFARLLASDESFNLFFNLLQNSELEIAQQVWELLVALPHNEALINQLKQIVSTPPSEIVQWDNLIDPLNCYKLYYSLQIVDTLARPRSDEDTQTSNISNDNNKIKMNEWSKSFISLGGVDHLQKIVLNSNLHLPQNGFKRFPACALLLELLGHFQLSIISFGSRSTQNSDANDKSQLSWPSASINLDCCVKSSSSFKKSATSMLVDEPKSNAEAKATFIHKLLSIAVAAHESSISSSESYLESLTYHIWPFVIAFSSIGNDEVRAILSESSGTLWRLFLQATLLPSCFSSIQSSTQQSSQASQEEGKPSEEERGTDMAAATPPPAKSTNATNTGSIASQLGVGKASYLGATSLMTLGFLSDKEREQILAGGSGLNPYISYGHVFVCNVLFDIILKENLLRPGLTKATDFFSLLSMSIFLLFHDSQSEDFNMKLNRLPPRVFPLDQILDKLLGILSNYPVIELRGTTERDTTLCGLLSTSKTILSCMPQYKWSHPMVIFGGSSPQLNDSENASIATKKGENQMEGVETSGDYKQPKQKYSIVTSIANLIFKIASPDNSGANAPPVAKTAESRNCAFDLLLELVSLPTTSSSSDSKAITLSNSSIVAFDKEQCLVGPLGHLYQLVNHFILPRHQPRQPPLKTWNYNPIFAEKSPTGYVGLRNLAATCYMNSLMQQFYMVPQFRAKIFSLDPFPQPATNNNENNTSMIDQPQPSATTDNADNRNVVLQLQTLFAFLQESQQKYYDPTSFTKVYKGPDGRPMNPMQQMDAEEFFAGLLDKIESVLKSTPDKDAVKTFFGGTTYQMLEAKECGHVSNREDDVLSISLEVKGKSSIYEALDAFVRADILEGDNKYRCSQCNQLVDARKYSCLAKLPDNLCFSLKRFDFDLESLMRVKVNDYFEFPMTLNVEPYTSEGLQRKSKLQQQQQQQQQEKQQENKENPAGEKQQEQQQQQPSSLSSPAFDPLDYEYVLSGIVIHRGTTDSGHYYSYIKDRSSPPDDPKWYTFNDMSVDTFEPSWIPSLAYGGDEESAVPGRRSKKNYSAYMLFYTKSKPVHQEVLKSISPSQLSDFVPSKLYKDAWVQNRSFLVDQQKFDKNYLDFIEKLTKSANDFSLNKFIDSTSLLISSVGQTNGISSLDGSQSSDPQSSSSFDYYSSIVCRMALSVATETLAQWKTKTNLYNLLAVLTNLGSHSLSSSISTLLTFANNKNLLKRMLMDCPIADERAAFAKLISTCLLTVLSQCISKQHENASNSSSELLDDVVDAIINPTQRALLASPSTPDIEEYLTFTSAHSSSDLQKIIQFFLDVYLHTLLVDGPVYVPLDGTTGSITEYASVLSSILKPHDVGSSSQYSAATYLASLLSGHLHLLIEFVERAPAPTDDEEKKKRKDWRKSMCPIVQSISYIVAYSDPASIPPPASLHSLDLYDTSDEAAQPKPIVIGDSDTPKHSINTNTIRAHPRTLECRSMVHDEEKMQVVGANSMGIVPPFDLPLEVWTAFESKSFMLLMIEDQGISSDRATIESTCYLADWLSRHSSLWLRFFLTTCLIRMKDLNYEKYDTMVTLVPKLNTLLLEQKNLAWKKMFYSTSMLPGGQSIASTLQQHFTKLHNEISDAEQYHDLVKNFVESYAWIIHPNSSFDPNLLHEYGDCFVVPKDESDMDISDDDISLQGHVQRSWNMCNEPSFIDTMPSLNKETIDSFVNTLLNSSASESEIKLSKESLTLLQTEITEVAKWNLLHASISEWISVLVLPQIAVAKKSLKYTSYWALRVFYMLIQQDSYLRSRVFQSSAVWDVLPLMTVFDKCERVRGLVELFFMSLTIPHNPLLDPILGEPSPAALNFIKRLEQSKQVGFEPFDASNLPRASSSPTGYTWNAYSQAHMSITPLRAMPMEIQGVNGIFETTVSPKEVLVECSRILSGINQLPTSLMDKDEDLQWNTDVASTMGSEFIGGELINHPVMFNTNVIPFKSYVDHPSRLDILLSETTSRIKTLFVALCPIVKALNVGDMIYLDPKSNNTPSEESEDFGKYRCVALFRLLSWCILRYPVSRTLELQEHFFQHCFAEFAKMCSEGVAEPYDWNRAGAFLLMDLMTSNGYQPTIKHITSSDFWTKINIHTSVGDTSTGHACARFNARTSFHFFRIALRISMHQIAQTQFKGKVLKLNQSQPLLHHPFDISFLDASVLPSIPKLPSTNEDSIQTSSSKEVPALDDLDYGSSEYLNRLTSTNAWDDWLINWIFVRNYDRNAPATIVIEAIIREWIRLVQLKRERVFNVTRGLVDQHKLGLGGNASGASKLLLLTTCGVLLPVLSTQSSFDAVSIHNSWPYPNGFPTISTDSTTPHSLAVNPLSYAGISLDALIGNSPALTTRLTDWTLPISHVPHLMQTSPSISLVDPGVSTSLTREWITDLLALISSRLLMTASAMLWEWANMGWVSDKVAAPNPSYQNNQHLALVYSIHTLPLLMSNSVSSIKSNTTQSSSSNTQLITTLRSTYDLLQTLRLGTSWIVPLWLSNYVNNVNDVKSEYSSGMDLVETYLSIINLGTEKTGTSPFRLSPLQIALFHLFNDDPIIKAEATKRFEWLQAQWTSQQMAKLSQLVLQTSTSAPHSSAPECDSIHQSVLTSCGDLALAMIILVPTVLISGRATSNIASELFESHLSSSPIHDIPFMDHIMNPSNPVYETPVHAIEFMNLQISDAQVNEQWIARTLNHISLWNERDISYALKFVKQWYLLSIAAMISLPQVKNFEARSKVLSQLSFVLVACRQLVLAITKLPSLSSPLKPDNTAEQCRALSNLILQLIETIRGAILPPPMPADSSS